MLIIHCPYCGPRPEIEFAYGGQAHVVRPPDPSIVSADDWTEFLYLRNNTRGLHAERWRHVRGCARFFNAVRDTISDFFVMTYKLDDQRPDLARLASGQRR